MTLSDIINQMIETALSGLKMTSASPNVENTFIGLSQLEHPNLEEDIKKIIDENLQNETDILSPQKKQEHDLEKIKTEITQIKRDTEKNNDETTEELKRLTLAEKTKKRDITQVKDDLKVFDTTSIKQINNMSSTQLSNLQGMTKDPFKFMLVNVFKKFARGAGVLALATIIFTAVQIIISELMKPGRLLDRIFKRVARDEILLFNSREEQAELRQGFRTVIVTTMPFLSGSEVRGQVSGNLYNPTAIPQNRLDPRRVIPVIVSTQNASRGSKFFNRRSR